MSTVTIAQLKEKLHYLSQVDKKRKIDGADWFVNEQQHGHEYKSYPVSEVELVQLEQTFGIQLPQDYRNFLLHIGWGAGPGYRLLNPEEVVSYTRHFSNDPDRWFGDEYLNEETGYGELTYFRELTSEHIAIFRNKLLTEKPRVLSHIAPVILSIEGAVVINKNGGGYCHALVVEGELRGTIWNVAGGNSISSIPQGMVTRKEDNTFEYPTMPFTFFQWIENWLDESIEEAIGKN
ncbi:SMI1/KNR4 family protein [Cytophagaceae bacterium DM2B3-1]|uniref:SMI1/KNR4 family protein n=1 Tax=Xanthocytophaga flava TaxID=3048013 RepID=A0ABT7CH27_9BACT|nr:SMI1/KNR4 family protein [Xanthocytophaga flavus]MDJ1492957.1 SMI1/KNR4 family protein [Xanthocytophaga flavus]